MFNPNYQLLAITIIINSNSSLNSKNRRRRCDDDSVLSPLNFLFFLLPSLSSSSLFHHQPHINFWCRFGWSPSVRTWTQSSTSDRFFSTIIGPMIHWILARKSESLITFLSSFSLFLSRSKCLHLKKKNEGWIEEGEIVERKWGRGASRREKRCWMLLLLQLGARDTRWAWTFFPFFPNFFFFFTNFLLWSLMFVNISRTWA